MSEDQKGEPKSVEGYIITTGENTYFGLFQMNLKGDETDEQLLDHVTSGEHESPERARVFSKKMTRLIASSLETSDWRIKPTHLIPATWSEDGGVTITGEKISIEDLPKVSES